MATVLPEITLSNGKKIYCLRRSEVHFVHQHIQEYYKNGIKLQAGDTVFDVGANIGLFTLSSWEQCKPNGAVYAFEPIPAVFNILKQNIRRYNLDNVKLFPYGISRENGTLTFTYYPRVSVISTAYPEGWEEDIIGIFVDNPDGWPGFIRCIRWLPRFLRTVIIGNMIKYFLKMEKVDSNIVTISHVIREHNIQRIDLLKVDVEKSELDVFMGIEDQDWLKIKQIVAEVHHRVDESINLLKNHGFNNITVEQELGYKNSKIFNLYALR